jgi:hypothetical protein
MKRIGVITGIACLILGQWILSFPASAQAGTDISITPLRTELDIAPGVAQSGTLTLTNGGEEAQDVSFSAETFNVKNEAYDYTFTQNTPESSWIRFTQSSLQIAPGKSVDIGYSVNVPTSAEPAGYYVALLATHTPNAGSGIIPSAQVASLLYITVTGDTVSTGKVLELRSPVVSFGTARWSASLQNTGTVHFRSNYTVTLRNMVGQAVGEALDSRLILPGSIRFIDGGIPDPEIIGIYRLDYTIGLGNNPGMSESRWVLYIPPLQGLLVMGILAGLTVLVLPKRKH